MRKRSSSDLTCALYKKLIQYGSWCGGKTCFVNNECAGCMPAISPQWPTSRPLLPAQLAKGLFLRNAFIQRQFVAGSWVVSRGLVTLLKGGRNWMAEWFYCQALCDGLPDSYQCNWTLDSRGHGSWITHKRQWTHAEEVGLQVTGSGCALFVGFLLVIHSNEVKWAEQAHQGGAIISPGWKGKSGQRSDKEKLENRLLVQSVGSFLIYFTVSVPSASLHWKEKSPLYA